MARALSSYHSERQRAAAIERRLLEQRGGLGYWAAMDGRVHQYKNLVRPALRAAIKREGS